MEYVHKKNPITEALVPTLCVIMSAGWAECVSVTPSFRWAKQEQAGPKIRQSLAVDIPQKSQKDEIPKEMPVKRQR